MDFSGRIRQELARVMPKRRCCQQAELAAFVDLTGEPTEEGVVISTGTAAVARKVFLLAKQVHGRTPVMTRPQGGRRSRYTVRLPLPTSPANTERDCCARAYLRGAWLSRGSVNEPDAGYHLEFVAARRSSSRVLQDLLDRYGVTAGLTRRKSDYVVYIKGADGIAELLRLTGAHGALLDLEDFRVLKEMRNRINRLVNAESSNVEKAVTAALNQVEDIRLIDEHMGLSRLPPSLKELAYVRLTYPDASLRDLGRHFDPPLSKSAVNHRMRRLSRIAEDLRRNHPGSG